jgi:hypothetical protein
MNLPDDALIDLSFGVCRDVPPHLVIFGKIAVRMYYENNWEFDRYGIALWASPIPNHALEKFTLI